MRTERSSDNPTIAKLRSFPDNPRRYNRGNPNAKLTKALATKLCDLVSESHESLTTILDRDPSLPGFKAIYNWQQRVPWFRQMWKETHIKQSHYLAQYVLKLAEAADPKTAHVVRVKFDIFKFIMAKFNPDFFGDKPAHQPQQTTVNVGISISPERLTEIRGKLDQTRHALNPRSGQASTIENGSRTLSNGELRTKSSVYPKRDVTRDPERAP